MSRDAHTGLRWGSLLLALAWLVVPLPEPVQPMRPFLLAVLLAYWALEAPRQVGLGMAFFCGLLADVLAASLLGENAVRLAVLVYLVQRFRTQLRFFPIWQQAASIGLLLLNDLALVGLIRLASGAALPPPVALLAPAAGMLLWPWLYLLLDALRLRQRGR